MAHWSLRLVACSVAILAGCAIHMGPKVEKARATEDGVVLAWEPVAGEPVDPAAPPGPMTDIRYELRVWRESFYAPVVQRRDLREPTCTIRESLEPGRYRWTVRARFRVDGKRRVGPWSMVATQRREFGYLPPRATCFGSFVVPKR